MLISQINETAVNVISFPETYVLFRSRISLHYL